MKLHSVEFVRTYLHPVINQFHAKIYGGFVRDLIQRAPFSDVDVDYPTRHCDSIVKQLMSEFKKSLPKGYEITEIDTLEMPANGQGGPEDAYRSVPLYQPPALPFQMQCLEKTPAILPKTPNISRTRFLISNTITSKSTSGNDAYQALINLATPPYEDLQLDVIWNNQASANLDMDIHALYLTPDWRISTYTNRPGYRNAYLNACNKTFICLQACESRRKKLIKKGYTEFTEGMLNGLYEDLTNLWSRHEYQNSLYTEYSSMTEKVEREKGYQQGFDFDSDKYNNFPPAQLFLKNNPLNWRFRMADEPKGYECPMVHWNEKRAIILVPKGLGFPLEPFKRQQPAVAAAITQVDMFQFDGYYIRTREQIPTYAPPLF